MKQVKQTNITVFNETASRYDYDRISKLTLSEEHFTSEQIAELVGHFISLAVVSGQQVESHVQLNEVPVDEEESWKVKYEARNTDASKYYTEKTKAEQELRAQKEENAKLRAQIEALKSVCHDLHVPTPEESAEMDRLAAEDAAMREAEDAAMPF